MNGQPTTDMTAVLIGLAGCLDPLRDQVRAMGDLAPSVAGAFRLGVSVSDSELRDIADEAAAAGARTAIVSGPLAMRDVLARVADRLRGAGLRVSFWPTTADILRGAVGADRAMAAPTDHAALARLIGREPRPIDPRLVEPALRGKRVLITGAGGSIGSELARIAARYQPERLMLMDRSDNALFEIDRQIGALHPDVERATILHDVVDPESTRARLMDLQPHTIFHAAAHKHVPLMEDHPIAAINNNLFGTRSVADAAHACGAERFVMISTDKAVNPTSVMGATKRLAEIYIRSLNARSGTRFSLVRFGNVLGSNCSVLPIWAGQVAEGGPITVTHPEMERFFMTIPEAAGLVIQAATIEDAPPRDELERYEVFVLDMGEPVRILDLAERFARSVGLEPAVPDRQRPPGPLIDIAFTGIRPGEKLFEELAYAAEELTETSTPGILAWAGPRPCEQLVGEMIRDLTGLRAGGDPEAALEALRRHVPALTRSDTDQGMGPAASPHAGLPAHAA